MKIEGTQEISHPAPLVFATLRDKTPELVRYMPNIESLEVISREDDPPIARLYNRWQGSNADVPRVARPFASRDLAAWFDRAEWNEETLVCHWELESVLAKEIFECNGTTSVEPRGDDACLFKLEAELTIHADRVPGVPRFLAKKVRGPIERFIANALRPNLTSIAGAVQQYLDAQAAGGDA